MIGTSKIGFSATVCAVSVLDPILSVLELETERSASEVLTIIELVSSLKNSSQERASALVLFCPFLKNR